jgi:multimeric flavodoxin WrbA
MKILAIMGSPKGKGNGYKAVKRIEDKMKEMGGVEFEYLFLKDANLQGCKGCFLCVSRGEEKCPLKDDREAIEKKILASDGVILSSPGYVQNVSWLMKNFIDRFAYTNHRLKFFDQKVVLVANSGAGMKEVLKGMRNALGGGDIVSEVEVSSPPWPINDKMVKKNEKALDDAAKKLYGSIKNKNSKLKFGDYMRFRFFKAIAPEVKEYLPADFQYYKDKEYFYDTKIPFLTNALASVIVKIVLFIMKDMGPKK